MKNIIVIGAAAVSLTACKATPEQIVTERREIVNDMTFVKHTNGLCFAVTTSPTSAGWDVASVTNIPCQSGDTVFVK